MRRLLWAGGAVLVAAILSYVALRGRPVQEAPTVPELAALPVSAVTIPLSLSIDRVTRELELRVPTRFGGLSTRRQSSADPQLQYAFEAEREAFDVTFEGNELRVAAVVRYGGRAWYRTPLGVELTASCGVSTEGTASDAPRANVVFSSAIALAEDWSLRSQVRVESVEPLTEADRCVIPVLQFQLDATEPLMIEVRQWLETRAVQADSILAALDLRPPLEAWWEGLQEPITLTGAAWLSLNPQGVGYRLASGSRSPNGSIEGAVRIDLRPAVTLGSSPDAPPSPLPQLDTLEPFDREPASETDPEGQDAWVVVEGRARYAELSELAAEVLVGRSFTLAGRTVEIESLRLSGGGEGRLTAEVGLGSGLQGALTLTGTPIVSDSNEIDFPDLSAAFAAKDLPAQLAGRFLLPEVARRWSTLPLGEVLSASLRGASDRSVDFSDDGRLEARLVALELTHVVAGDDELVVRSRVQAQAALRIGLSPKLGVP